MSEALIFASTNPQHDIRLLIELRGRYMNNLLSYCGLVDATISASENNFWKKIYKKDRNLEPFPYNHHCEENIGIQISSLLR